MLPAVSIARTVMLLFPIRSGIVADHEVVPAAIPLVPKLVDHATCLTATLSLAAPSKVMELAVVNIVPVPGDVIVRLGGVVSTEV